MFRLHLLVYALDLPGLLDVADDMDEAQENGLNPLSVLDHVIDDRDDFRAELASRYPGSEIYCDE